MFFIVALVLWFAVAPVLAILSIVIAAFVSARRLNANRAVAPRGAVWRWGTSAAIAVGAAVMIVKIVRSETIVVIVACASCAATVGGAAAVLIAAGRVHDAPTMVAHPAVESAKAESAAADPAGPAAPAVSPSLRRRTRRRVILGVAVVIVAGVVVAAIQTSLVMAYRDDVASAQTLDERRAQLELHRDVLLAQVCLGDGAVDERFRALEPEAEAPPPVIDAIDQRLLRDQIDEARAVRGSRFGEFGHLRRGC